MSLIRVSTKKTIRPHAPSQSIDVQYPKKWFDEHPNAKPTLSITLLTPNLEEARKAVRKGMMDNAIDLDLAKTFLYYMAKTIRYKLEEDWKSYKITIGQKNQEITPLDLIHVETTTRITDVQLMTAVTPADDGWIAAYLLAIYRLTKATVNEYKTQIAQRVSTQLKSIKGDAMDITGVVDMYKGWTGDRGYNTLVAAYDMFFHRFPLHPLANMRIGTTGSRFRDCAALISYGYIMDILGMPNATDLMDWVFIEQIGSDIDRMMTSDDELDDPYSYFPYHVDMGLVTKSAFSATANPHFFEWVHLIGSLMRSTRSLNARHISDSRALDILANAACVAYAHAHTFSFTKVYTEDGEELQVQDDDLDQGGACAAPGSELDAILKSRDPESWCIMIQSSSGELPLAVKKFIAKSVLSASDIREGTMEEHLKRLSTVFLK